MPRLSIVIVSDRSSRDLETTLVSVLENRPADSEILVALAHEYDDPYHLEGEVGFVPVTCGKRLAAAQRVLDEASGDVVHLLGAGSQATEGWAEAALDHFERDPHIGSVAPLVLDAHDRRTVVSAGISYVRGGNCRPRRSTLARSRICESQARPEVVLGPAISGGFYRRDALAAALSCAGFVAGDAIADADIALSLAELGFLAVLEPRCLVLASLEKSKPEATVSAGRAAEAVFWRHAAVRGWGLSLAAHTALVAREMCAIVARPALAKRLLGRLLAICELPRHLGHTNRLAQQIRLADEETSTSLNINSTEAQPTEQQTRAPQRRAA